MKFYYIINSIYIINENKKQTNKKDKKKENIET